MAMCDRCWVEMGCNGLCMRKGMIYQGRAVETASLGGEYLRTAREINKLIGKGVAPLKAQRQILEADR